MSDLSFTAAYWDWLRRLIPEEPLPADVGLTAQAGEALARMLHREFELQAAQRIEQFNAELARRKARRL